ncbi:hypothetical protein VTO73DRAFT_488 [Trametes versicolor]
MRPPYAQSVNLVPTVCTPPVAHSNTRGLIGFSASESRLRRARPVPAETAAATLFARARTTSLLAASAGALCRSPDAAVEPHPAIRASADFLETSPATAAHTTFGKVFKKQGGKRGTFTPEDISKSLLYAISNNIGQIAYMNAEKYNLDRIYFGGYFIRGHAATISTLSYAIRFWSKGTKRALFLRHEGFLGAIGAWIKNIGEDEGGES